MGDKVEPRRNFIEENAVYVKLRNIKKQDRLVWSLSCFLHNNELTSEVPIDGLEDGYHSITYILMKNSDKVPIDYLESVDLSEIYEILFDSNKDKDLKFTLYYGNAEEVPLDFYLVGLLDFKQIPLTKNEEKSFYDDLNPNEEKSIEITIDKSKLIDKKSFQLLMITSPFESVNKEQPFLFHSSMASNRVKLNNIE